MGALWGLRKVRPLPAVPGGSGKGSPLGILAGYVWNCNTSQRRNVLQFHDKSGFCELYHQLGRGHLGQQPVELVKQPGRVDGPSRLGGPEGPLRHPDKVAVGQQLKGRGTAGDLPHLQELGLHGAGTHRRDGDLPPPQLLAQPHGEGGHVQ